MAIVDKIIDVLDSFVVRPIGLSNKDYKYMIEHLDRNIGNGDFDNYDGYGTPIGQLSNPYYNAQVGSLPLFYTDSYKLQYANYIDYINSVYGSTFGTLNINETMPEPVSFSTIKIDRSDMSDVQSSLAVKNSINLTFNPNKTGRDSELGKESAFSLKQHFLTAINENDKHIKKGFSVTPAMADYFGLNTNAINNGILTKFNGGTNSNGRYEDPTPLSEDVSPVYTDAPKWGNYKGLGVYEGYFNNSSSSSTMGYYLDNIKCNKYKPNTSANSSGNSNYIDAMKITVGKETDYNGSEVRYVFSTLHTSDTTYNNEGHTTGSLIGGLKAYGEAENGSSHSYRFKTFNSGVNYGKYTTFDQDPIGVDDLLNKTNQAFMYGKYDTLIGRFHSSTDYPNDELMSSSVSKAYGMSHGRNLLRGDAKNGKTFTDEGVGDGYDNPYCRVWTYHHQYHRLKDAIRPFTKNTKNGEKVLTPEDMQKDYNFGSFRTNDTVGMGSGGNRLTKYGVLGYNTNGGLVNIAPKKGHVDIKNCMFSIENLAWKGMFDMGNRSTYDTNGLSSEQKGPFGGRIMWFPPYDIKFSEQVSTNWNANDFIGRGESLYTYTNTSRDGTLSFKLLIDHPAILDYWKRRNETDTSSTVDDVDSPEQQLLRFFAGCEMLSAKEPAKEEKKKVPKDEPQPAPSTKEFKFFIFYPNDYSGQDDRGNNLAIPYLLNGVGTQYRFDIKQGSLRDNPDMYPWYNSTGVQVGGYEVRSNGISIVKNRVERAKTGTKRSYITSVYREKERKNEYQLAKEIGSYKGLRIEWYYRIDGKRRNEKLTGSIDYVDTQSFKLNSGGQQEKIRSTFGVNKNIPIYALTDVYMAFSNDSQAKTTLSGYYNETNVQTITKLIEDYGINEITVRGWASNHGVTINAQRNNDLNKNRRETAMQWIKKCSKLKNSNIKFTPLSGKVGPGPKASNVSDLAPKLYRCAEVTVKLNTEKVDTAQNVVKEKVTKEGSNYAYAPSGVYGADNVYNGILKQTNSYLSNSQNFKNLMDKNQIATSPKLNSNYQPITKAKELMSDVKTMSKNYVAFDKGLKKNSTTSTKATTNTKSATVVDTKAGGTTNESAESKAETVNINEDHTVRRYDNEADFFKGLELNDPVMRHKITEKIKYFDPAFHSISPEGFAARLTFLHQCTRQGPTVGNSDLDSQSANNLSFGRAPVCILRIGDFYYTKVIFTSMTIDYDPLQWDLNPEGIGVMPMIANVSLSFHFLGGSSLAGPISRLQNSLSFNYYGVNEVYDDRAEQVNYDNNGEITQFKTFPY